MSIDTHDLIAPAEQDIEQAIAETGDQTTPEAVTTPEATAPATTNGASLHVYRHP
jgi:ATP-dependent RNA helicase DeaD